MVEESVDLWRKLNSMSTVLLLFPLILFPTVISMVFYAAFKPSGVIIILILLIPIVSLIVLAILIRRISNREKQNGPLLNIKEVKKKAYIKTFIGLLIASIEIVLIFGSVFSLLGGT